jgi:hypothetical protein
MSCGSPGRIFSRGGCARLREINCAAKYKERIATMKQSDLGSPHDSQRRAFLKRGVVATGAAALGTGWLANPLEALAKAREDDDSDGPDITFGDVAVLRFLAAAEILESDLWQQYNELAGVAAADSGYVAGLEVLDEDMPQYISDNTDDEISHELFLNAYLKSKGDAPVDLDQFRTLAGSQATGAKQIGRLTNLMQLSVDTSFWARYRSTTNPDLGATFPQAVPTLAVGQHPAIPRNDAELGDPQNISTHVQAIANTAGFHFAFIEQGGTSLYAAMAQKVTSLEVLRIVVSIGGAEVAHFQTWQDKAGNAPALTDGSLMFPDLNAPPFGGETFQTNLIMPEPCEFLNRKFPRCSIIRPTSTKNAAMGAVNALSASGLFSGQSDAFFQALRTLASDADAARRRW